MLVKKKLLDIPYRKVSKQLKQDDYCANAVVVNINDEDILNVDFYDINKEVPIFRFFCDGKNHIFYDLENERWHDNTINYAFKAADGYYHHYGFDENVDCLKSDFKTVRDFLGEKAWITHDIGSLIYSWVSYRKREKYEAKQTRKYKRIDSEMGLFGKPPHELKKWLRAKIFKQYVFFSKLIDGKRSGYCTCCHKRFKLPKDIKHKTSGTCPKCGKEVTYFADRYVDSIREKIMVCYTYKLRDGRKTLRFCQAELGYFNHKPIIGFEEDVERVIFKNETYEIYYNKTMYWCGKYWRKAARNSEVYTKAVVYPESLKLFDDKLVGCFKAITEPCRVWRLFYNLRSFPQTEFLLKQGLSRLAEDLPEWWNEGDRSFTDITGLSKQYLPLCRKYNTSFKQVDLIKNAKCWVNSDMFERVLKICKSDYAIDYLVDILRYKQIGSLKSELNYLIKQSNLLGKTTGSQIVTWHRDYLSMCRMLGVDIGRKSVKFPKNLKEAHDRVLKEKHDIEVKKYDMILQERADKLYEGLPQDYIKDGFAVLKPNSRTDFIKEGESLSHCVGRVSTYYTEHITGDKMIFFIRRADDINTPFVTMQLDLRSFAILQIYGFGDKKPNADVIKFARGYVNKIKQLKGA